MNIKSCAVVFLALLGCFAGTLHAEEVSVDSLRQSEVGAFPSRWKTYPFYYGKAEKVYKVVSEGGKNILRAEDKIDASIPIFKDFHWDVTKYPYLKFKWRAQILPAGARETSRATNDSACAVYVGFGRTSALKYTWSSTLPVGSYWAKEPGKFYIIVKNSGASGVGHWHAETVAVPSDYAKYFGKELTRKPSAACDYADFRISSTP